MQPSQGLTYLGALLDAAEASPPVDAVEGVTRELGRVLGASAVSLLIADLSGRGLVRLAQVSLPARGEAASGGPQEPAERRDLEEYATALPFDGGPAEQVVRSQAVQVLAPTDARSTAGVAAQWQVLAPVTERGESIGLLELWLPERPSADAIDEIARLAHLLAFVVIANRRHTDLFEWGQRTRRYSLSAEIQQRLLPGPHTCEAGAFTLSGWLEPAADIAGDTFDYSLERNLLHLSLTDAMGHGVSAALTATLCVGSLRLTRRGGGSLLEQAARTNAAIAAHAAESAAENFVTGLLGRLDLPSGSLHLVNAGHNAPYLARGSHVAPIDLAVDLPLGMFPHTQYRSTEVSLEPGDRVLFVTDGMLERNAAGLDLPGDLAATRSLHPREAVRALADRVLEVTGHQLSDDATVLCLDWHGGHGRRRETRFGGEPARVSRAWD